MTNEDKIKELEKQVEELKKVNEGLTNSSKIDRENLQNLINKYFDLSN